MQEGITDRAEREKVWMETQKKIRLDEREAEKRAAKAKIDNMSLEEKEEYLRQKEEQAKHDKQQSKHLMLLAKSTRTKKKKSKGKGRMKNRGRGRSK